MKAASFYSTRTTASECVSVICSWGQSQQTQQIFWWVENGCLWNGLSEWNVAHRCPLHFNEVPEHPMHNPTKLRLEYFPFAHPCQEKKNLPPRHCCEEERLVAHTSKKLVETNVCSPKIREGAANEFEFGVAPPVWRGGGGGRCYRLSKLNPPASVSCFQSVLHSSFLHCSICLSVFHVCCVSTFFYFPCF